VPRLSNERREVFARTYVATWSTERAADAAGYAQNNARNVGAEPEVANRIAELVESMLKSADITAERVMLELARVGFSDIRKIVDVDGRLLPLIELDDDIAASIAGIEVESRMEATVETDLATGEPVKRMTPVITTKIKKSDKVAALNILAKHFKLVGDEGDGVNALASALADRLQSARTRRVINSEGVEDARITRDDTPAVQRGEGQAVPQSGDRDRSDPEG
jgi:phage terminase small subunit